MNVVVDCSTVSEGGDPVRADRGRDKEDEMHTEEKGPQVADGNSKRSQRPPIQSRTLSRR